MLLFLFKPTNASRGERYHFAGSFIFFSHLHLLTFFHFHTYCSFSCSAQKHAKSERAVYIDGTERD